jgi:aryl-alcohol dehydrogenase-like predicted oxidoreductase
MEYRPLGHSGLKVSALSLGSWTTYGGSVEESDSIRIIRRAFDLGINLFDTADVYVRGGAETVLGRALRELPREQLVVATKCMGRVWEGPLGAGLSRKHVFDAMDQSLRRLGLDYVDLYQIHAPDTETPLEETLEAFEDLVRMGKARYIGFSNFDHHPKVASRAVQAQRARGWSRFIASQPRWNLLDRHVEREHLGFCRRHGLGMIVYSPLAQGVLTDKYAGGAAPEGSRRTTSFGHFLTSEKALTPENVAAATRFARWVAERGLPGPAPAAIAWVLSRPQVASAIIGATTVAQLEENVTALEVRLDALDWAAAEAAIAGTAVRSPRRPARPTRPARAKRSRSRKPAPGARGR